MSIDTIKSCMNKATADRPCEVNLGQQEAKSCSAFRSDCNPIAHCNCRQQRHASWLLGLLSVAVSTTQFAPQSSGFDPFPTATFYIV